ncbi:MAG: phytanoyl-CoA dioxygenase family protein [Chloroflexi bacterium]|nr:phytanoyl-CoA dioxygenase family protein [Chloroflexota bacterium]
MATEPETMATAAITEPHVKNRSVGTIAIDPHFAVEPGRVPPKPIRPYPRYRVSVNEYITFHQQGFLIVRNLVPSGDVQELIIHTEDLMHGKLEVPGLEPPPPGTSPEEIERRYLRIHMLHRVLEPHERFLLHPRILDVLEALIGPDVMAMQSMLFLKFPGGAGQGYHQDSYYIPTVPDTLCGAWLAVDRADEENGCLWFSSGSQNDPIYPTAGKEYQNHGDAIADLPVVDNVSHTDESVNTLSRVAQRYRHQEVPAIMEPGDVAFFGGHIIHHSHDNYSQDRFRRSFVGHYANARSFTLWGYGEKSPAGTNHLHILARGWTHLPFGQPRFGTACAANTPSLRGVLNPDGSAAMMANMAAGEDMATALMDMARNDPAHHHDDA